MPGATSIVESRAAGSTLKLLVREGETVPQGSAFVRFDPAHTRIYARRLGGEVRP